MARVDVAPYFSDPDGDTLAYAVVSSDIGIVGAGVAGGIVVLIPVSAGAAVATVTATDSGGLSATQPITVTVRKGDTPGRLPACRVGLVLHIGESCTVDIPNISGGDNRFHVTSDGRGCYGIICAGDAMNLSGFRASRQSDGRWRIDALPDDGGAAPDLVVKSPEVSSGTVVPEASFTLSATVRNQGAERAAPTTLRYYRSSDSTISTSDTEVGTDFVFGLAGGASGSESIRLTAPTLDGTYYYGACVEAVSQESDTGNNCSAGAPLTVQSGGGADLVVESPGVSSSTVVPEASFTLSATVRNQGAELSATTTLRYYRSSDSTISTSDTEVGTDFVFGLAGGASGSESIRLTAPTLDGTYYYGACVEAVSQESDTGNNCSAGAPLTVQSGGGADLVVESPGVSSSTVVPEASFTLSATVRNQGAERSATTTLRYYRSSDSTISTSDTEVGTDFVFGLAGGASGSESIRLTAPTLDGTYYYGACVEAVSQESDTGNNCSAGAPLTVQSGGGADLVVESPGGQQQHGGSGGVLHAVGYGPEPGRRTVRDDDLALLPFVGFHDLDERHGARHGFRFRAGRRRERVGVDSPDGADPGRDVLLRRVRGGGERGERHREQLLDRCAAYRAVGRRSGSGRRIARSQQQHGGSGGVLHAVGHGSEPGRRSVRVDDLALLPFGGLHDLDERHGGRHGFRFAVVSWRERVGVDSPDGADPGRDVLLRCVRGVGEPGERHRQQLLGGCTACRGVGRRDSPGSGRRVSRRSAAVRWFRRRSFTLSATVRNQGAEQSASTALRYYRSSDSTISTSDLEVGTDSVPELPGGVGWAESIRLTAPSSPGTHYYGACVESVSEESDTGNNCSAGVSVTVESTGGAPPDLVAESPEVSSNTVVPEASFTLSATVRNQGAGRSDSTTLRYYRSPDSTISTSDTEVGTDFVSRLTGGASGLESIRLTAPNSPGTYYYGACVEPVREESDTGNNCSAAVPLTVEAVAGPDLVVESPEVSTSSVIPGKGFTLSATVRNQGGSRSATTTLHYYRSLDSTISTGDMEEGTDSVFGLSAGRSGLESIRLTAPNSPGTYYYGACVEPVSEESDTGNNCSAGVSLTVESGGGAPDLVAESPEVSRTMVVPDGFFTLSATVRNQGIGPSGSTTLRYYRSSDSTISTNDTEVETISLEALTAGGRVTASVLLRAPSSRGTYYYGACVDSVSGESDTGNNCSAGVRVEVGSTGPACTVGQLLSPGEFCTVVIPGFSLTDNRFRVTSDGRGCYEVLCVDGSLSLNGFVATKQSDGRWRIDALP